MTALEDVPGNDGGAPREGRPSDETHANGFASQSSSHNPARPAEARNAFGLHICSDCGAVADGINLRHDDSCPIGRDIDATMAEDRDWFESHAGAAERRRPMAWAERESLKAASPVPEFTTQGGNVVVRQIVPGVRTRHFEVYAAPVRGERS